VSQLFARGGRTLAKIARAHLLGQPVPLSVPFVLTYRCNGRCTYCGSPGRPSSDEMTPDQTAKLLQQVLDAGAERIGLTGGEPLLRPDLGDLVARARDAAALVTVNSNGLLVEERLEALRRANLLLISVDGPPDHHDRLRGAGSFDAAVRGIRAAASEHIPVGIVCTLTRGSELSRMLDLAEQLGVRCLFQPVMAFSFSAPVRLLRELWPSREEMRRCAEDLLRAKAAGRPVACSRTFLRFVRDTWPGPSSFTCAAGKLHCAVSPEGRVAPCNFLLASPRWPSALEHGFRRAFERLPAFRCRGCFCPSPVETTFLGRLVPEVVWSLAMEREW
jgi:MoaA/NifB/PqqE/SkfB family radical SAM enzyme